MRVQRVGGEVHHRCGHHADVDHVDAGGAQAARERRGQFRAGFTAIAPDGDLCLLARNRFGADGVANVLHRFGGERAPDDAADVVGFDDFRRYRRHR